MLAFALAGCGTSTPAPVSCAVDAATTADLDATASEAGTTNGDAGSQGDSPPPPSAGLSTAACGAATALPVGTPFEVSIDYAPGPSPTCATGDPIRAFARYLRVTVPPHATLQVHARAVQGFVQTTMFAYDGCAAAACFASSTGPYIEIVTPSDLVVPNATAAPRSIIVVLGASDAAYPPETVTPLRVTLTSSVTAAPGC